MKLAVTFLVSLSERKSWDFIWIGHELVRSFEGIQDSEMGQ